MNATGHDAANSAAHNVGNDAGNDDGSKAGKMVGLIRYCSNIASNCAGSSWQIRLAFHLLFDAVSCTPTWLAAVNLEYAFRFTR